MNKPVAIVNTNCENNIQWYDDNPKQHNGYFLYTHPVKELTLTRDEIRDVWRENPASFTLTPLTIEFAKAILRKAQEK